MNECKCESVILCEGFLDRAFWAGWLTHLGCSDPGIKENRSTRAPVRDPWNSAVTGGQFAFLSASNRFIRIIPCGGKPKIPGIVKTRLNARSAHPLGHLVFNVDSDQDEQSDKTDRTRLSLAGLPTYLEQFGDLRTTEDGDWVLDDETMVSLVTWTVDDAPTPGLPSQQTLERLVCAALVAAYPDRGPVVSRWLDMRPEGPDPGPKEFAWSYMAGWYADLGCEAFYRRLWKQPEVVEQLESRLRECEAWRIAETLAR